MTAGENVSLRYRTNARLGTPATGYFDKIYHICTDWSTWHELFYAIKNQLGLPKPPTLHWGLWNEIQPPFLPFRWLFMS